MILTRNLISHLGVIIILTQIILFTWFVSGYFHLQGLYENLEFLGVFANTLNENWLLKEIHI